MRMNRFINGVLTILVLLSAVEIISLSSIQTVEANTIFTDGFESQNFSAWSSQRTYRGGTISVTNAKAHHGTYSCKATFRSLWSEGWTRKTFTGQLAVYGRWYVYIDRLPDSDGDKYGLGGFGGSTNDYCGYMYLYRSGGNHYWQLRYFDGWTDNWQTLSGVDTPQANTWFCIEIYSKAGAGTAEYKAWINGVLGCTITGKYQPQNLVWFEVGGIQAEGSSDQTVSVYADCVVVSDTYIGPEEELPPQPIIYKISIDSTHHNNYGLAYPVTYVFIIPSGSSNLKAYYRHSTSESWSRLEEKTSTDFFNGIECVRFDYSNNKAYVSVAFSDMSDDIYVKITDQNDNLLPIAFDMIAGYYDNRKAVVVATADDWDGETTRHAAFMSACDAFQSRNVWLTVGITTVGMGGNYPPNYDAIQGQLNEGYIEVASHSRTHPHVPYSDYDSEIGGSKSDIIENLTLPPFQRRSDSQSIWAWIEPYGESDSTVRQKLSQHKYLIARTTLEYQNSFASWNSDEGLFERYGVTIKADDKTLNELNSAFDEVYSAAGIYHFYFHPASFDWSGPNILKQHLDYIRNKTDVWYVGFGALYAYQFARNACTIEPEALPAICEFQAPSIVYANRYFFLNATIYNPNGVTNVVNATIEISNGIILKWDNTTNTFSKLQDIYGYCTLDGSNSFRTIINSSACKLSWKIKLSWSYPEGSVSVIATNTKVFDSRGLSRSGSYNDLFTFEDDLVVYSASVDDSRINPSQPITFTGTLYYQGTTIPPEDTSGIIAKVNLENSLKGSTTNIGVDGIFSIEVNGELNVGQYSYIVYATTDENTVQNQTINVIVDRIIILDGGATKETITLGESTTIWFTASYEHDETTFDSTNGILYLNGEPMTWSLINERWEYNFTANVTGTITFTITAVLDTSQGLTTINDIVGAKTINVLSMPFAIISNSTITELTFDSTTKTITFKVSGPEGTIGYTNVTIAKTLIQNIGELTIYLDGNQITYTFFSTEYTWLIHFTYTHSTHKVTILLTSLNNNSQPVPYLETAAAFGGILIAIIVTTMLTHEKARKTSNPTKE